MNTVLTRPLPLLQVGETCSRQLSFSRQDIADFARLTGDSNLVHTDDAVASRSRHQQVIASGQQTAAQLIGLASSHCARSEGGAMRDVLCLNFNFSFKAPVFADTPLVLQWSVATVEWSERLQGWIGLLDGTACAGDRVCVVGRGTLLVSLAKPAAP